MIPIQLSPSSPGRTFEGVGAVSAGASTRNLVDFPEPQRSEVLDFLFKPNFGASLHHLKVEIGGDDNSTCGSEPSHVISREELSQPKARGYEFWLMAEARKRNPSILLDCLPWCYPSWISGRFSQDSADWYVAFLNVARDQFGLEIDWVGAGQNEMGTDLDWVANILRPTLDRAGYSKVRLQGPDHNIELREILEDMDKNPVASVAIEAVTYHYPSNWLPKLEDDTRVVSPEQLAQPKARWASEEFSYTAKTWDMALLWAQLINKNYIRERATKSLVWCPVDGINPGIEYEGTGLMEARESWSGFYDVWPGIWTTAHTTQFTQPGWVYMDGGCGKFDPGTWQGSYVSLRDPLTNDWSVIVCTGEAKVIELQIGDGLVTGPVHAWKSDANAQFVALPDLVPVNGKVQVALDANALYSFTTTTGQSKGEHGTVPASTRFPLPYREDFESYDVAKTPRYISDQKGTFETALREDGKGKCLRLVTTKQGILWFREYRLPYTVWGDKNWSDYTVRADVQIVGGHVEVGGRFDYARELNTMFALHADGTWKLFTMEVYEIAVKHWKEKRAHERILGEGSIAGFDPAVWHTVEVTFQGTEVQATLDGTPLASGTALGNPYGLACLASSWDANSFDNLEVVPA